MTGECDDCCEHTLECQCPRCFIDNEWKRLMATSLASGGENIAIGCPTYVPPNKINDLINHPPHYKGNKFEVIDIIEDFGLSFRLGNAIKYILRAGKKGDRIEDLKKAIWYINREIENENN
jgi:hypothetical protein